MHIFSSLQERIPSYHPSSIIVVSDFIFVKNYLLYLSSLKQTQIFFGKLSVLRYHNLSLGMLGDVLTHLLTVCSVNSNRNTPCKYRTIETNNPFRGIEAYDANSRKFRNVISNQRSGKFHTFFVKILVCVCHPFVIDLYRKSRFFTVFFKG